MPSEVGSISEEGTYEPSGSEALKRSGSRLGRAGGFQNFQKNLSERLKEIRKAYPEAEEVELSGPRTTRSAGSKAGDAASVGAGGKETRCSLPERLQMDLSLRLRASRERRGLLANPLPTVNVELFSMALDEFANNKEVGAGKDKNASFWWWIRLWVAHRQRGLEVPEGIHLEFLPSLSPPSYSRRRGCGLFNQRGSGQWALRRDRGDRGGTDGALSRTA